MAAVDPLTAGAVLLATAATDAVYVMFTSAVVARKRAFAHPTLQLIYSGDAPTGGPPGGRCR